MNIALVTDKYEASKVEAIKKEMLVLGAPVIKAVWMNCYGHWAALEGCHRVRAAYELGLVPEIEEVDYDEEMVASEACEGYDGDQEYTVAQIADMSNDTTVINFED